MLTRSNYCDPHTAGSTSNVELSIQNTVPFCTSIHVILSIDNVKLCLCRDVKQDTRPSSYHQPPPTHPQRPRHPRRSGTRADLPRKGGGGIRGMVGHPRGAGRETPEAPP